MHIWELFMLCYYYYFVQEEEKETLLLWWLFVDLYEEYVVKFCTDI